MAQPQNEGKYGYGGSDACKGTYQYPVPNTTQQPSSWRLAYLEKTGKTANLSHCRAICSVCGKECGLRKDGTIRPHVNTPVERARRRTEKKQAATIAVRDLIRLRQELQADD